MVADREDPLDGVGGRADDRGTLVARRAARTDLRAPCSGTHLHSESWPGARACPARPPGSGDGPEASGIRRAVVPRHSDRRELCRHPLIQRRPVSMPPALTITSQIVLGVLAGAIGVAVATPLTAAAMTIVRVLYVEDVLEQEATHAGWMGKPRIASPEHCDPFHCQSLARRPALQRRPEMITSAPRRAAAAPIRSHRPGRTPSKATVMQRHSYRTISRALHVALSSVRDNGSRVAGKAATRRGAHRRWSVCSDGSVG